MSIYIPQNLSMVMQNAWWIMVLRGVIVVLLGLIVLLQPEISLFLFLQLLGAYWFVDGLFVAFGAIRHRAAEPRWWVPLLRGLIGIVAGIFIFLYPYMATVTSTSFAIYLVGFLAIVSGVLELIIAIRIRKDVSNEWTIAIAGIFSIVLGLILIANPARSLELLLTVVGIAAVVAGIFFIIGGVRLRLKGNA